MRTKLRSKTGDIDLGRKRSKAAQCQSSGRRCKYRRRHANVTNTPTSAPKLRVATYNVHGCMGMDRQRSEARIAEVIAELSVDIVALQELDLGRRRSAGADQTKIIAEQLGWYSHFHPAMRRDDEHYGNAILSHYRLTFRRAVELPGRPPFFAGRIGRRLKSRSEPISGGSYHQHSPRPWLARTRVASTTVYQRRVARSHCQ